MIHPYDDTAPTDYFNNRVSENNQPTHIPGTSGHTPGQDFENDPTTSPRDGRDRELAAPVTPVEPLSVNDGDSSVPLGNGSDEDQFTDGGLPG